MLLYVQGRLVYSIDALAPTRLDGIESQSNRFHIGKTEYDAVLIILVGLYRIA